MASFDVELKLNDSTFKAQSAGGSGAHNNMPPFMALNYIICINGFFPTRS